MSISKLPSSGLWKKWLRGKKIISYLRFVLKWIKKPSKGVYTHLF